ncbi:hypothetical protein EWM64_g4091 [Hericium alpestre]|uniref:BTB domain-containing protein n=1 Tax=Hericium alpestre TaxID=135208 RepID=A0A4Z0A0G1_9AGAM|nr:hypothetical protein EWM64_g4091 [Hericium alpestre]
MLVVGSPIESTLGERLATVTLPDPTEDVYRLLKALYFRLYATERPQNMEVLASLLRMATKYMVDNLRKEVIARLEILFPDTLEKYNSQDRKAVTPPDFDPIIAVELSLACDVPAILPTALYLSILRENAHSLSIGLSKAVQMGIFPPLQAHYRCLSFKDEFRTFTESAITSAYNEPPWACRYKDDRFACSTNKCYGIPVHSKRALELRLSGLHHDMFLDSTFLSLEKEGYAHLCPSCLEKIKAYQSAIRSKVWETGLPSACGWRTWGDVKSGRPPTIKGATA